MRERGTPYTLTAAVLAIGAFALALALWSGSGARSAVTARAPVPAAATASTPAAPPLRLERSVRWLPEVSSTRMALGHTQSAAPASSIQLRLLRWPDRAPLEKVPVTLHDAWRYGSTRTVTAADGRLALDDVARTGERGLVIQAEGYETSSHTLSIEGSARQVEVVLLRPTRGWYGQVVDWEGKPVEGASIAGFWVEEPRPVALVHEGTAAVSLLTQLVQLGYVGDEEAQAAPKPEEPADDAGGPPEPDPPEVRFFSGKGRVAARFSTNAEGWYYLPPLSGPVIGRLTLIATKTGGSSDVLRVSLPQDALELPEIVIHRPWVLQGTVVDTAGYPLSGARILLQLADGWSPAWPPLVTDERGAFQFEAPLADLALAVEKSGYALQGADLSKPESSDGMWEDLARIAPHGSDPALLFRAAYGGWKTLLPRARRCVRVEFWQPKVLLMLAPLPALEFVVVARGAPDRPIPGARVLARFGGHDAGEVEAFTDLLGSASVRSADREWQPTLIQVSAEGFHPRHFALPPGKLRSPWRVALRRIDEEEGTGTGSSNSAEDVCAGLVVGPNLVPRSANVAIYSLRGRRSILWSGPCDEDGRFEFSRPRPNEMLLACALWEDDGVRFGVQLGPLAASLWPLAERLELRLESGTQMDLDLHGLQAGVPYRIRWQVSAMRGLPPLAVGLLPVPEGARSRYEQPLSVPSGWMVEALVEAGTVDNVAEIDFFRGERRELPYPSTRITWQNWVPVSRRATRLSSPWRGRMALVVGGRVSIHGTVANMPWLADPNSVHVAATGEAGTWIASIDGNGWFDIRGIPPGVYRLVLFSRRPETTYELTDQGDVIGSVTAECTYRFNQVVIPWGDAGDAGGEGQAE